eukprot:1856082-Rhodomonas_salina.2
MAVENGAVDGRAVEGVDLTGVSSTIEQKLRSHRRCEWLSSFARQAHDEMARLGIEESSAGKGRAGDGACWLSSKWQGRHWCVTAMH